MPITNTRQDTTVLIYLKVSLISKDFSQGGGEKARRGAPGVLPALCICGDAEDHGALELEPLSQETSVGGVVISPCPRSGRVVPAGGNPGSSPWTPATPQARINATRARLPQLSRSCMLLPAPVGVRWLLCSFESGDQQGKKDRTLGSATPATPLLRSGRAQPRRHYPRANVTQVCAPVLSWCA